MKPFCYWRDCLFLTAALSYGLNRFFLKPMFASRFLHGYFNDLLLIPAALPVILWIQRLTSLRTHDGPPSWAEMLFHLTIWSSICEGIGPLFFHHGRADLYDVGAYALGGIVACLWWNRSPNKSQRLVHNEF